MQSGFMRAMQLDAPATPLRLVERPLPSCGTGQILIEVSACGVCRTDLHVVDGDLRGPLPIIPAHEVVGRILDVGVGVNDFNIGDRIGVPWLGHTCGHCPYCLSGQENLCDDPVFTGFSRDGGFATHCVADARYCFRLPEGYADAEAAPLLCAGLIGYRSYRMAGHAHRLGFYGFGAAAHILAQMAVGQGREVYAFTRPDDENARAFARRLGCVWAGSSEDRPPEELDAAIIFAPAGPLVPAALRVVRKGGRVICAGIHMTDIPAFPYADLWGERLIRSVANLTRQDGEDFLALAGTIPIRTSVEIFPLHLANDALHRLRAGDITGAAVLQP